MMCIYSAILKGVRECSVITCSTATVRLRIERRVQLLEIDVHGSSSRTSNKKTSGRCWCGVQLCDVVYLLHSPEGPPEVEIILIHGLQRRDSKDAYWKTWLARDGSPDNCWPITWLSKEFPQSKILSLSYDAGALQTPTSGRMDLYALGENLLPQMLFPDVGIGQNNCPVMFVCHCLGGLVAKQIVVTASQRCKGSVEIQNLVQNLKAFFFYATPHAGSKLAEFVAGLPFVRKGPLLEYLRVLSTDHSRLNTAFEEIQREVYNNELMFSVVAETLPTTYNGLSSFPGCGFHEMVVEEASARYHGYNYYRINADHFDVCKPTSKEDTSFQALTQCISNVVLYQKDKLEFVSLPDYLVGMDDMKDTVCRMLESVSVVGVVGMGGIGKTTLSKAVYKSRAVFYKKTCFLQDVRSKESVACAQKQLLKDLCGVALGSSEIVDERHLKRIQECIKRRKVLVVIDDVGDSGTLDALQVPAIPNDNKSVGKVIVTSRNWQALESHVSSSEGRMNVAYLNAGQAEELFFHYAFKWKSDDDDDVRRGYFEGLAKNIAKACCGLPLSLEVISRFLGRKHAQPFEDRKEIWQEASRRLREASPLEGGDDNEDLWKRLRISYDDLRDPEKSMFLDFACVFCNLSKGYFVFELSDRSIGWIWNSRIGMQNLIDRSLIKFDERSKGSLTMHDQLRDMGRRIVKDLSMQGLPGKPNAGLSLTNMTRLWDREQIQSFLKENKSSTSIQGISLDRCNALDSGDESSSSSFEVLEVAQPQAHGGQKGKVANGGYSYMRLLDLHYSGAEVVRYFIGKCWTELHWLCLDDTDITMCHIEAIGSLCKGLRVLRMRSCGKIEELPGSIGNLVHLLELDLYQCMMLETLPESIGRLKRLKRLGLSGCYRLKEIPAGVGQLRDLVYLDLDGCWNLQIMCEFESKMEHLSHLNISNCPRLGSDFKSLGNLHRLCTLLLGSCPRLVIEDLPGSLKKLSQLQRLDLWGCHQLVPKEAAEWDLVISNLMCCKRLEELRLPAISKAGLPSCPVLKVLCLENGLRLEEFPPSLGDMIQLETLLLEDSDPPCCKKVPESLRNLVGLKELVYDIPMLDVVPECVGHLTLLQSLTIFSGYQLVELPESLGQLSQLKKLRIKGWGSKNMESLGHLSRLQRLQIDHCDKLECLPGCIGQLSELDLLEVWKCKNLKQLPESLGKLSRLQELVVWDCTNLECLPESLARLEQLAKLELLGCGKLDFREVGQQSLLRDLRIHGCHIVSDMNGKDDESDEEGDDSEEQGDFGKEDDDDPEELR